MPMDFHKVNVGGRWLLAPSAARNSPRNRRLRNRRPDLYAPREAAPFGARLPKAIVCRKDWFLCVTTEPIHGLKFEFSRVLSIFSVRKF